MRGNTLKVVLRRSVCNHLVCEDCWADIVWIDHRQHLVLEFVGRQNIVPNAPQEEPEFSEEHSNLVKSVSSARPGRSPNNSAPIQVTPRSTQRVTESPEPSPPPVDYKPTYRRSCLLFRCPICQCFLKDRLTQYINSDITLNLATERSIRIQSVLSEAEQGDVILHKHVQHRDLVNIEIKADSVHKAKYGHQIVAVKYFKPYFLGFEWPRFRREVAILAICAHPYIISFIGAHVPAPQDIKNSNWQDEESTIKPFIVLEYGHETLNDIIRSSNRTLLQSAVVRYAYQIATAVQFLHSMNLAHRDIKPANIVVTSDQKIVKLIDFGESRVVSRQSQSGPYTKVGTPFYEAPEISAGLYTDKVDIFSFGKMFYEMITKSVNPAALDRFYEKPFDIGIIRDCHKEFIPLIESCCNQTPLLRPDFDQISKQLNEFNQKYGTETDVVG